MTVFRSISQRVVSPYQRQLAATVPDTADDAQRDLRGFFEALYASLYDDPAAFGLPVTEDVYVDKGDGKDRKAKVAAQVKKVRVKLAHAVDFLWLLALKGTPVGGGLQLSAEDYGALFAKGPRVKRKMLAGMEGVGLTLSEADGGVIVASPVYTAMLPALRALGEACARMEDDRLAKFLLARCDLRTLDPAYEPDPLDMLRASLTPSEYQQVVGLHHRLGEMAYAPNLRVGDAGEWQVQYQGRRAVKSTPFFEFDYDGRKKRQLEMQVKAAAANRLVPLLPQQPASLQADFFEHAHNCGGCGWCKNRKALGPTVLEHEGEKKTICWYMRRRFAELDAEAVGLVMQYAQLHEDLATG